MISEWLDTKSLPVFWLAKAEPFKQAVSENGGFAFEHSIPIFHGDMFANAMPLSPWLVPVDESLAAVSKDTLQQGLFFTSSADLQDLTDHLRSLLTAGLDGEEVVFRFYDPKVLLPMLTVMDESDLNALFGNIKELTAFCTETDQLQTWSSTRVTPFELQPAPWWRMKEAHLKPLYSTQTHTVILEKRFWEVLPESMEALDQPVEIIKQTLVQAQSQGFNPEQGELAVLNMLVQRTPVSMEEVCLAFHLSNPEQEQLLNIQEKFV
ncbi:DUF4123 domain-containing protein [Vibrio fluvialis]